MTQRNDRVDRPTTPETEGLLEDWMRDEVGPRDTDALLAATLARTAATPRRARWRTRDWWRSVLGFDDWSPPRLMLSVGIAALLATLVLAAAVAGLGLLDDELRPPPGALIVAADGSGDYLTVGAAVADADDGAVIWIMPGRYEEAVATGLSLTFAGGSNDPTEIVIVATNGDRPVLDATGESSVIERLTFEPSPDRADGAEAALARLTGPVTVADVRVLAPAAGCGLVIRDGPGASVRRSSFSGGDAGLCLLGDGTPPADGPALSIVEASFDGLRTAIDVADEGTRGRFDIEVIDSRFAGSTTAIAAGGAMTISGNDFRGNGTAVSAASSDDDLAIVDNDLIDQRTAIRLERARFDVSGNRFAAGDAAVSLGGGATGRIAANEIVDSARLAIEIRDADARILDNRFEANANAIQVVGGDVTIVGNEVRGTPGQAIAVSTGGNWNFDPESASVVFDNVLCDNGVNFPDSEGFPDPTQEVGNTICDAPDRNLRVVRDGSGDATSISAALEMADDGDAILVEPGTYEEALRIDRDVTLIGAPGDGGVVFERPADTADAPPAITLVDSSATLRTLTLRGPAARVVVDGGSPTLTLRFDGVGGRILDAGSPPGLTITGGARVLADGEWTDTDVLVADGASLETHDSVFVRSSIVASGVGTRLDLRRNELTASAGVAVAIREGADAKLEDNTITDAEIGVEVDGRGRTTRVELERGRISGSSTAGIVARGNATGVIWETTLRRNDVGIRLDGAAGFVVQDSQVQRSGTGIEVIDADPILERNGIGRSTGTGLAILGTAAPRLTDNVICDNAIDLVVATTAAPTISHTNEICTPAATEAPSAPAS